MKTQWSRKKKGWIFVLCFLLIILIITPIIIYHGAWEKDELYWSNRVKLPYSDPYHVEMVVEGNTIHMLYTVYKNKQVTLLYLRSSDNGKNWNSPHIISNDVHSYSGELSVSKDNLIIFWGNESHLKYVTSKDNGRTWSDPFTIVDKIEPSGIISAEMTRDEIYIYAVHSNHSIYSDYWTGLRNHYLFRSEDNGDSWNPISPNFPWENSSKVRCYNFQAMGDALLLQAAYNESISSSEPVIQCDDGALLISRDGGYNWEIVPETDDIVDYVVCDNIIHAINVDLHDAEGTEKIFYKNSNDLKHWSKWYVFEKPIDEYWSEIYLMSDGQNVFIVQKGGYDSENINFKPLDIMDKIYISLDNGNSWGKGTHLSEGIKTVDGGSIYMIIEEPKEHSNVLEGMDYYITNSIPNKGAMRPNSERLIINWLTMLIPEFLIGIVAVIIYNKKVKKKM